MAKHRRHRCKVCGITSDTVHISKRGYCIPCGKKAQQDNTDAMRQRSGPQFEHWLDGWINSAAPKGRPITPYPPDA